MAQKILVGIDGSPGCRTAATWAVEEARVRKEEIDAVFAWLIPSIAYSAPGFMPPSADEIAEQGKRLGESAFGELSRLDVVVNIQAIDGRPADVLRLIAADPDIDLAVVGSRGRGGVMGLLLGSVSEDLTHHFPKPLVIVPGRSDLSSSWFADRRVVVGVDGSPPAMAALRWAAEEARQHADTILEVVVAWSAKGASFIAGRTHGRDSDHALRGAAMDVAARAIADLGEPDLPIVQTFEEGQPAEVLLRRAASADLLVVGTRDLSRTRAAFVGSVSHACTQRASRPIAVIPHPI